MKIDVRKKHFKNIMLHGKGKKLVFHNLITSLLYGIFLLFPKKSFSKNNVHWVDFPAGVIENICYDPEPIFFQVNKLGKYYHSLEKTKKVHIKERIQLLKKISSTLINLLEKTSCKDTKELISGLAQIANEKSDYLSELLKLENVSTTELKKRIYQLPTNKNNKYLPLYLRNTRKYDFKEREFWGEFFLEAIDPCHRKLDAYYQQWKTIKKENDTYFDFFLWLEGQKLPTYIPFIQLLPTKKLNEHKVFIHLGKVYDYLKRPLSTNDKRGEPIFIIDLSGNMLFCHATKHLRHTSLSRYKPILGSGSIYVEVGVVKKIALNSGHYTPGLNICKQTLYILLEKGLQIEDHVPISYYKGFKKIETNFSAIKNEWFKK